MIENEVINLIGNVGFPIAAFILIWYQNNTVIRANTKVLQENNNILKYIYQELCNKRG